MLEQILENINNTLGFFSKEGFLLPFWSTVGASFTVLLIQFLNGRKRDKRKKIYAVTYISDVYFRLLYSNLILKKNPIIPHIKTVKRIIEGDEILLNTMFLADEFDILTDKKVVFFNLPEEYKVLLGMDDIKITTLFETIMYLESNDRTHLAFNEFVKTNLKSSHSFNQKTAEEQLDSLNTYWDYLDKIEHQTNRLIFFVYYLAIPEIEKYLSRRQFWFFPKKRANDTIKAIKKVADEYSDFIPQADFLEKVRDGGIVREL